MKNELNPAIVQVLVGALIIAAAAGGMGYLYLTSIKTDKDTVSMPVSQNYHISVLATEFDATGIFLKTRQLHAPAGGPVVATTPSPVSPSEIGKSNLGSLE